MAILIDDTTELGQYLIARNLARQYDFLHTAFMLRQSLGQFTVDLEFIAHINFYGVHFVSPAPGMFRFQNGMQVTIRGSDHSVPMAEEVEAHMADFMAKLADASLREDPLMMAAYVLWRLNWVHPFPQGNGRTARALSYFVLCSLFGVWFPGEKILPELIRDTRDEYCTLLNDADKAVTEDGLTDLIPLRDYLERLLTEQLESARPSILMRLWIAMVRAMNGGGS